LPRFTIDPKHSEIGFAVRHMMVSTVRGRFTEFDADIDIDEEQPERSRALARIRAASLTTGDDERDTHLRSADFFDVEQYPEMTYRSSRTTKTGADSFELEGDLTIRGVTRPVTLRGEFTQPVTDPWGGRRVGFTLSGEIDREEFGLRWNMALEAGGMLVGRTVKLNLELEVVETAPAEREAVGAARS
jgi:polyisoprenoid-binding protein YceI